MKSAPSTISLLVVLGMFHVLRRCAAQLDRSQSQLISIYGASAAPTATLRVALEVNCCFEDVPKLTFLPPPMCILPSATMATMQVVQFLPVTNVFVRVHPYHECEGMYVFEGIWSEALDTPVSDYVKLDGAAHFVVGPSSSPRALVLFGRHCPTNATVGSVGLEFRNYTQTSVESSTTTLATTTSSASEAGSNSQEDGGSTAVPVTSTSGASKSRWPPHGIVPRPFYPTTTTTTARGSTTSTTTSGTATTSTTTTTTTTSTTTITTTSSTTTTTTTTSTTTPGTTTTSTTTTTTSTTTMTTTTSTTTSTTSTTTPGTTTTSTTSTATVATSVRASSVQPPSTLSAQADVTTSAPSFRPESFDSSPSPSSYSSSTTPSDSQRRSSSKNTPLSTHPTSQSSSASNASAAPTGRSPTPSHPTVSSSLAPQPQPTACGNGTTPDMAEAEDNYDDLLVPALTAVIACLSVALTVLAVAWRARIRRRSGRHTLLSSEPVGHGFDPYWLSWSSNSVSNEPDGATVPPSNWTSASDSDLFDRQFCQPMSDNEALGYITKLMQDNGAQQKCTAQDRRQVIAAVAHVLSRVFEEDLDSHGAVVDLTLSLGAHTACGPDASASESSPPFTSGSSPEDQRPHFETDSATSNDSSPSAEADIDDSASPASGATLPVVTSGTYQSTAAPSVGPPQQRDSSQAEVGDQMPPASKRPHLQSPAPENGTPPEHELHGSQTQNPTSAEQFSNLGTDGSATSARYAAIAGTRPVQFCITKQRSVGSTFQASDPASRRGLPVRAPSSPSHGECLCCGRKWGFQSWGHKPYCKPCYDFIRRIFEDDRKQVGGPSLRCTGDPARCIQQFEQHLRSKFAVRCPSAPSSASSCDISTEGPSCRLCRGLACARLFPQLILHWFASGESNSSASGTSVDSPMSPYTTAWPSSGHQPLPAGVQHSIGNEALQQLQQPNLAAAALAWQRLLLAQAGQAQTSSIAAQGRAADMLPSSSAQVAVAGHTFSQAPGFSGSLSRQHQPLEIFQHAPSLPDSHGDELPHMLTNSMTHAEPDEYSLDMDASASSEANDIVGLSLEQTSSSTDGGRNGRQPTSLVDQLGICDNDIFASSAAPTTLSSLDDLEVGLLEYSEHRF